MKSIRLLALGAASMLSACASVMEGTSESVAVNTNPPGATCNVDRAGTRLGTISPTPGSVNVSKSKNDLTVTCTKEGYEQAQLSVSPKFVGTTFGNVLIGGGVGAIVDAATGASFDLPDQVSVSMAPVPAPTAAIQPSFAPTSVSYMPGRW